MTKRQYVHGFEEADALMRELPKAVENKVLQSAARAGGNVWRTRARNAAPRSKGERSPSSKKYGSLFKNIKTFVLRKAKAKGQRGVRVSTGRAFWGLLLEHGTAFIAAKPWFRPAIEASDDEALKAVREELGAGIERETEKLARKYGVK